MPGIFHHAGCCCGKCYLLRPCVEAASQVCTDCASNLTPRYFRVTFAGIELHPEGVDGAPSVNSTFVVTQRVAYDCRWQYTDNALHKNCDSEGYTTETRVVNLKAEPSAAFHIEFRDYTGWWFVKSYTFEPEPHWDAGKQCQRGAATNYHTYWPDYPCDEILIHGINGSATVRAGSGTGRCPGGDDIVVTNNLVACVGKVVVIDNVCYEVISATECTEAAFEATITHWCDDCADCLASDCTAGIACA